MLTTFGLFDLKLRLVSAVRCEPFFDGFGVKTEFYGF